ncbi:MAG: GNAT family N-acetyltransferase [Planctomycetota bacterium]|jgi:RimJ/RimL family protein N-acetyltransferase
MKLVVPTKDDCERVRIWRNNNLESLRTSKALTKEEQQEFYWNTVCKRTSPHRYWSIMDGKQLVGFGGLTFIEWENRLARISLILDPAIRKKGYGEKSVDLILDYAFNYLGLKTVCGECYCCNPAFAFWQKIYPKYSANPTWRYLPNKKYWDGKFYDSFYFSFDREDYAK